MATEDQEAARKPPRWIVRPTDADCEMEVVERMPSGLTFVWGVVKMRVVGRVPQTLALIKEDE